jgi:transcriptional regulator with XRE-family HTH domain
VATYASPTVRRRRLAAELRRLRGGRRAAPVANALGWSMAKISRYELGRTGYPPEEVAKLLDYYKVPEPRRGRLLALAEDANRRAWWDEYSDSISPEYQEYVGLEAEAESVVGWSITNIPGLLQTEAYARELNSFYRSVMPIAPSVLDRRVSVRMIRQQVLTKRNPPLDLSVVIDESALLRPIGGAEVMRSQLGRVADLMDLPNVRLQVLPLTSGTSPPPASFQVFGFSGEDETAKLGDVVSMEGLAENMLVEGETDTYIYRLLFQKLTEVSLSVEESRQLILQTSERLWS